MRCGRYQELHFHIHIVPTDIEWLIWKIIMMVSLLCDILRSDIFQHEKLYSLGVL